MSMLSVQSSATPHPRVSFDPAHRHSTLISSQTSYSSLPIIPVSTRMHLMHLMHPVLDSRSSPAKTRLHIG